MVKHLPTVRETRVQSLGLEDLLKKETATHSSILAGKSHGQRSLTATVPGVAESNAAEPLHFTSHTPLKSLPMAKSVFKIYF